MNREFDLWSRSFFVSICHHIWVYIGLFIENKLFGLQSSWLIIYLPLVAARIEWLNLGLARETDSLKFLDASPMVRTGVCAVVFLNEWRVLSWSIQFHLEGTWSLKALKLNSFLVWETEVLGKLQCWLILEKLESVKSGRLLFHFLFDIRRILISFNLVDIKFNLRIVNDSVGDKLANDDALLTLHVLNDIAPLLDSTSVMVLRWASALDLS